MPDTSLSMLNGFMLKIFQNDLIQVRINSFLLRVVFHSSFATLHKFIHVGVLMQVNLS